MSLPVAIQTTRTPIDGSIYVERPLSDAGAVRNLLTQHKSAGVDWAQRSLQDRITLVGGFLESLLEQGELIAEELTWQMGRPIGQAPHELGGVEERARTMLSLAPAALERLVPPAQEGFTRYVEREPLGCVLVLAPWNYPYLTAINTIIPALVAGNTVLLKHSDQTPLCAERLSLAAQRAGLPSGVFSHVHMSHATVAEVVGDSGVNLVAFTGSVEGGRAVRQAMGTSFAGIGLELGGKDPAYVIGDSDVAFAASNLVDGAFYNAGQSCCAVERIYVQDSIFDTFVEAYVAGVKALKPGSPLDPETTLGPLARPASVTRIQGHVSDACNRGARSLVTAEAFAGVEATAQLVLPQVLVDVDHGMLLMTEESFGPVVGIQRVASDEEAIGLMNDSRYGLTASVWTPDLNRAQRIGQAVHTGTIFANRCDYLDPELSWVGVKDSGRGCTLSSIGFEHLTRPKSFHMRAVAEAGQP